MSDVRLSFSYFLALWLYMDTRRDSYGHYFVVCIHCSFLRFVRYFRYPFPVLNCLVPRFKYRTHELDLVMNNAIQSLFMWSVNRFVRCVPKQEIKVNTGTAQQKTNTSVTRAPGTIGSVRYHNVTLVTIEKGSMQYWVCFQQSIHVSCG